LEGEVKFILSGRYFVTPKFEKSLIQFKKQVATFFVIFLGLTISWLIRFALIQSLKILLLVV
jgi:hypothetical protein